MFVRIKTKAGQIKQTEVSDDDVPVLEQAFVQNEVVTDFDPPLGERHVGIRPDFLEKMMAIAGKFTGRTDAA